TRLSSDLEPVRGPLPVPGCLLRRGAAWPDQPAAVLARAVGGRGGPGPPSGQLLPGRPFADVASARFPVSSGRAARDRGRLARAASGCAGSDRLHVRQYRATRRPPEALELVPDQHPAEPG